MAVTAVSNRKYHKQKPTKLPVGAKIHNRFDFYINDKPVAYGESEYQVGMAENIVLNQMYDRLCARASYFVNIHFGTGAGTLSAARTSLFTHLGTKTAVNDAQSKALPTSWWRQKIVLNPEEYVGSALSEVGVAFGATSTNLVTHALIKDINGNPITLTKTALDVVTIYATVYVTFSTSNANLDMAQISIGENPLVNYLIGATSFPTCYWATGMGKQLSGDNIRGLSGLPRFFTAAITWTTDVANKRFYSDTKRIAIGESNDHLTEVGFGANNNVTSYAGAVRLLLPATGVYSGMPVEGALVGTGDGVTSVFVMPSKNIDLNSLVVYMDGIETGATGAEVRQPGIANLLRMPGQIPAIYLYRIKLSKDGTRIQHAGGGDYQYAFKKDANGGFYSIGVPARGANWAGCIGGGQNADVFFYTELSAPFLKVYKYNDGTSSWDQLGDFTSIITSAPSDAWASDDGLTVCLRYSYDLKVYDLVDGTWVLRGTISYPYNHSISDVIISQDKTRFLSSHIYVGISMYNYIYRWDGTSFAQELAYSGGTNSNLASQHVLFLNNDANVAVVKGSNAIRVYDRSGTAWTPRSTSPLLSAESYIRFCYTNQTGTRFVVYGHSTGKLFDLTWDGANWGGQEVTLPYYLTSLVDEKMGCTPMVTDDFSTGLCGENSIALLDFNNMWPQITFSTPPGLVTSEAVGTGDGSTTILNLDHTPIAGSLTMKLDGVETTDYTANGAQITFNTAPGSGVAITADYRYECTITADYTVNGIHKTAQRVIDLYTEITFGEVT